MYISYTPMAMIFSSNPDLLGKPYAKSGDYCLQCHIYMWQSRVEIEDYSVQVKIEFATEIDASGLRLLCSQLSVP